MFCHSGSAASAPDHRVSTPLGGKAVGSCGHRGGPHYMEACIVDIASCLGALLQDARHLGDNLAKHMSQKEAR